MAVERTPTPRLVASLAIAPVRLWGSLSATGHAVLVDRLLGGGGGPAFAWGFFVVTGRGGGGRLLIRETGNTPGRCLAEDGSAGSIQAVAVRAVRVAETCAGPARALGQFAGLPGSGRFGVDVNIAEVRAVVDIPVEGRFGAGTIDATGGELVHLFDA
jgi:hypothetical protein